MWSISLPRPQQLRIQLAFLESTVDLHPDPYKLLRPVEAALAECTETVAALRESTDMDPDFTEHLIDDESEAAERLVGVAFMVCQVYVTGIVSKVIRLHAFAKRLGVVLETTDGTRPGIVGACSRGVSGSAVSEVRLIDEAANYAKHRDEWGATEWSSLRNRSQKTAEVLLAVGARQGNTGNCSLLLEKLTGSSDLRPTGLIAILENWSTALRSQYGAELRQYIKSSS